MYKKYDVFGFIDIISENKFKYKYSSWLIIYNYI
jgi:hypothetical protein